MIRLRMPASPEAVLSLNNDFSAGADNALACIFSLSGLQITDAERALFKTANPLGFILFKRNIDNPEQVSTLVRDLKELVGRDCPILIDQEGGRVQRLRPPHWREYAPMKNFGDLYTSSPDEALENLRFETLRLSEELTEIGVNVDCAPVLDVIISGAHDIVGDRSFSEDPEIVSRLGLSVCRHFIRSGITPIIKHIPGHGRAKADSHLELPRVDASYDDLMSIDFAPFRDISKSDIGAHVWAMTAHIVFDNIDSKHPVSVSDGAIKDVIRGEIGFNGILIADDLDMKALDHYGSASDKAMASLNAGCDLALYCAGELPKMEELARDLPPISQATIERLQKAAFHGNV